MTAAERELDILAGRLRARISERRYAEAQRALRQYCGVLRNSVARLPPGDPGVRRLGAEWQSLRDETRRRLLTGRAHAAARLARLRQVRPLYREPSPPRHTWEYTG
jgi:hypothetical protein